MIVIYFLFKTLINKYEKTVKKIITHNFLIFCIFYFYTIKYLRYFKLIIAQFY